MAFLRNRCAAPAVILAVLLVGFAVPLLTPPARAGTAIVFVEDFESGAIGSRWSRYDNNSASGLDYWDVTDYRAHAGNNSAWSAQIGTQSDTGLNNTAVHQYDDNMQADLVINLSVNGFTSLTLSFYYWSRAESGGGDFIQAWYEAGGSQFLIFTNTGGTGNKWDLASTAVPNNFERLIIRFQTDAANHGFEGAYVDDVVLTGTESVPPASSASPLPAYIAGRTADIPFTAQDGANESGVAYVELWFRLGTAGPFGLYTRPANPQGRWVASPVRFDITYAAGEGLYEFYTVAWDNAGNPEAPPATADATTTFDASAPLVTLTAPAAGVWLSAGNVVASWTGSDTLSGLDRYETSVDSGPFVPQGLSTTATVPGLADGTHTIAVRAFDRAGNSALATAQFGVDSASPILTITAPATGSWASDPDVLVSWTASDAASGIDRYETSLDNGTFLSNGGLMSQILTGLADGPHTFVVHAVDGAGNVASGNVTFGVDTTAPAVTVTSPSDRKVVHSGSPTVTWEASDAGSGIGHFEVWVDDGAAATTTAMAWTPSGLADGTHVLHIRAYDRVGNVRETSVTFAVKTDLFSWDGPYGPFPLLLLILVILAAFLVAFFLWWRRRKEREEPPRADDAGTPEEPKPPENEPGAPPGPG